MKKAILVLFSMFLVAQASFAVDVQKDLIVAIEKQRAASSVARWSAVTGLVSSFSYGFLTSYSSSLGDESASTGFLLGVLSGLTSGCTLVSLFYQLEANDAQSEVNRLALLSTGPSQ